MTELTQVGDISDSHGEKAVARRTVAKYRDNLKIPSSMDKIDTSKVPPPRSKMSTLCSRCSAPAHSAQPSPASSAR